ncbi:MAG: hypothetical protein LUG61_08930 [Lachnospiraceae bacterium]|nr:hypothetical protein [Lachnospiraceae bacterium]
MLVDDLIKHAQAFETGGENGVTAESTARLLRQAARTIKDQHDQLQRIAQDHITWEGH